MFSLMDLILLNLLAPTPHNGQTHSNNSLAVANKLFDCVWPFCGVDIWTVNALKCSCPRYPNVILFTALGAFYRGGCSQIYFSKGALKNFAKFTGKHLCQSLFFNNIVGLRPATLLKKRLLHMCFPVNFAKCTLFL